MEQTGEKLNQDGLEPNESEILPKSELELRDAAAGRTLIDPRHEEAAA